MYLPNESILDDLVDYVAPPRPKLNLGYACINMELREQKPAKNSVFTSRTCIQKTFKEKGLSYISELALKNVTDLATIIHWNHLHNIRFFRISSVLLPWSSEYNMEDLPDYEAIKAKLEFVGKLSRIYDQRLTFHPDHFTILCSPKPEVVRKSMHELEMHSKIFDLMGFKPSRENKINIHVGGVYNCKESALKRFAENYKKLSPNVRARLTLENDDVPNSYSVDDLYPLAVELGIAIVFDLHHQRWCKGKWSDREALEKAISTWPKGIRPVVHWSESQKGRKPLAHSDYVGLTEKFHLYGYDTSKVDIMIESKMKERSLLKYRDELEHKYENIQKKTLKEFFKKSN